MLRRLTRRGRSGAGVGRADRGELLLTLEIRRRRAGISIDWTNHTPGPVYLPVEAVNPLLTWADGLKARGDQNAQA